MRAERRSPTPALFCADLAADPLAALSTTSLLSPAWLSLEMRPLLQEHFARSEPPHLLLTCALLPDRARAILDGMRRTRFLAALDPVAPSLAAIDDLRGEARRFARWLSSPAAARLHLRLCGVAPDRPIASTTLSPTRMRRGQRQPLGGAVEGDALAASYTFASDFEGGDLSFPAAHGAGAMRVRASANQALVFECRERPWRTTPVRAGRLYRLTVVWRLRA